MKEKKMPWYIKIGIVLSVLVALVSVVRFLGDESSIGGSGGSVLALDLKGVLLDKQKFLKTLRKYSKEDKIKGILIRIDSPGGSVALSQEIYSEFSRIREVLGKPVVISAGSMMASGALYAAAGATFVLVNPGTIVGSIGVIFPMLNLDKLYEWAKVEPYSIKTGEFKDAGAQYRPITSKERAYFQDLINELLEQFKGAIIKGRGMAPEELEPFTDARVFTGEVAVSKGFADLIGNYSDAVEYIGKLTNLGKDPRIFTPEPNYFDLLSSRLGKVRVSGIFSILEKETTFLSLLGLATSTEPLYIFPPTIGM